MDTPPPFKWRHFEAEIILLCVRWYLRYSLSYRDLEEIMLERGLCVDHTTIYRWVQHYAPELEKLCRPYFNTTSFCNTAFVRVFPSQWLSLSWSTCFHTARTCPCGSSTTCATSPKIMVARLSRS
jgi:hypothetical protein